MRCGADGLHPRAAGRVCCSAAQPARPDDDQATHETAHHVHAHTLLGLVAVAVALATPAAAPAADPFADVVEKANKKLVKVFGAGGFPRLNNYGTGIVISKDGHILTVASQLLDTSDLVVHLYDGQRLKARGDRHRAAARRRAHQDQGRGEEDRGADRAGPDYFDFDAAAKRAPAQRRATGSSGCRNTFEIALRDEPLSVQRGVIAAYTKMAGPARHVRVPVHRRRVRRGRDHQQPRRGRRRAARPQGRTARRHRPRDQEHAQTDTWMNYAIPVDREGRRDGEGDR